MTLKSLEEFNQERRASYTGFNNPRPNGIACPKCGAEMNDSKSSVTLTSNPPQVYVACPKCGHSGTRVC